MKQLTLENYVGHTLTGVKFQWQDAYSKDDFEDGDEEEKFAKDELADQDGEYTYIHEGEVPSMCKITLSFQDMPDLTLDLNDGRFGFVERKEVVEVQEIFTEICPNAAVRDMVYTELKPPVKRKYRGG
jgi:hypothetical protein